MRDLAAQVEARTSAFVDAAITGPQAARTFGMTTAAVFPERGGPNRRTPSCGRAKIGAFRAPSEDPR